MSRPNDPSLKAGAKQPPQAAQPAGKDLLPETAFFLLMAGLFLVALLGKVDPDIFWRIKKGEMVLKEARFPTRDAFSFTVQGRPTAAHAWLSEIVFYLLYRAFGYFGIALAHALILTAAHYIFFLTLRKLGARAPPALAFTGLSFLNFLVFVAPRSQNFSFLFFAAALYAVALREQGRDAATWAIALMILPWANLHSGFVLGLGVLALAAAGDARARGFELRQFYPLLCGLAAAAIHPDGFRSVLYPLQQVFSNPKIKDIIMELKPLNVAEPAIFLPYMAVLAGLVLFGMRGISARFPWGLLCLGCLYQSLTIQRMVPYFAMAGLAALALALKDLQAARLGKWVTVSTAAFTLAMTYRYFVPEYKEVLPWRESEWDRMYPRESVQVIRERYPGKNIFCTYDWGGYLLFHLYPQNKVAIDSRGDPYFGFLEKAYMEVMEVSPRTKRILDKIGAEIAVVPSNTRLAYFLRHHEDWETVLRTPQETLLARRRGPPAAGAAREAAPRQKGEPADKEEPDSADRWRQ